MNIEIYNVPGIIKYVKQKPKSYHCWAACFTTMYSWKEQASFSMEDAIETLGEPYKTKITYGPGDKRGCLDLEDFIHFVLVSGLTPEERMNFQPAEWLEMLKSNGLLMVATGSATQPGGTHTVIVEGVETDGTPTGTWFTVGDPLIGKATEWSFAEFQDRFETLAPVGQHDTESKPKPDFFDFVQVVHWGKKTTLRYTKGGFPGAGTGKSGKVEDEPVKGGSKGPGI